MALRVAPVADAAMRRFLKDEAANGKLPNEPAEVLLGLAGGAPGLLIGAEDRAGALARARQMLAAADAGREQALRAAFTAGSSKARGAFSDVLDALTVLLHERARDATTKGDAAAAVRAVRAVPAVEEAKRAAEGNVTPQLVAARLLGALAGTSA